MFVENLLKSLSHTVAKGSLFIVSHPAFCCLIDSPTPNLKIVLKDCAV